MANSLHCIASMMIPDFNETSYPPAFYVVTPNAVSAKSHSALNNPESSKLLWCTFCENFGHTFRDSLLKLTCPILRKRVCPLCSATGDNAHTNKHCRERVRMDKQKRIAQFAKLA